MRSGSSARQEHRETFGKFFSCNLWNALIALLVHRKKEKLIMKTKLACYLVTFLGVLALQPSAHATFHLMQIEQVIASVSGDSTAQAVQLRMRAIGQNFVSGGKLIAFDAAGLN